MKVKYYSVLILSFYAVWNRYESTANRLPTELGLNDAFLFLRTYSQLSDGQKYRYRIAKLIESGKQWWLMDEFAACLDRDTAKIIAFNLQKVARQQGKAVIAATTHSDLQEDLKPSVLVRKRFGAEIQINYYPNEPAAECSLIREMEIDETKFVNWLDFFRVAYEYETKNGQKIFARRHVSGHASKTELKELIEKINPAKIIPVHTINPKLFEDMFPGRVILPI